MYDFSTWIDSIKVMLSVYGMKVLAAIAILVFGRWAAKILEKIARRVMASKNMDQTLSMFLTNLIYLGTLTFVVLAALSQLGIQTASFVAVIGAAGLAIGLALQGSLSNFAAGFLMIIFRPVKVGDFIEGGGAAGVVEKIQIFTTELKTPDNKTIIIPNSKLTEDVIINWSTQKQRRVDMVFGIGYGDDIDGARTAIEEVLNEESRILEDPAPKIVVGELGDNSVNFYVRPWVKPADYWDVYFALTEAVKKRFDEKGISIPFPQRDIHIISGDAPAE